ncbi:MAG: hypothetical protein LBG06_05345, partial [Deltaproteobacteria bacterium]|nr:hypothetical protein [Deltaproteobacteria bacterium]
RAFNDLGIRLIFAHSPQGKGRVERVFGTLQTQLVQLLKINGITDIEEANRYLDDIYLKRYNKKYGGKVPLSPSICTGRPMVSTWTPSSACNSRGS